MSLKVLSVTIQMKGTEQYFSAVLFIILYKVCSNFGLYGSPKHSNERY